MEKISDYLYYLKSVEEPVLSAETFLIKGNHNYIYDFGNNVENIDVLNSLSIEGAIISHFHIDHIGLWDRVNSKYIYASKFTQKYIPRATATEHLIIEDGVRIEIDMIPSSHAKGSLAVTINNTYTLLGDAIYGCLQGYNVSLLYDEIKMLESLNTQYFILSHKANRIRKKSQIIEMLKNIYKKNVKGNPYIPYEWCE